MSLSRVFHFLLFALSIFLTYSCTGDDQPTGWRPISMMNSDDSIVFEYNDIDRVERIIHYIKGTTHIQEERIEYDENGRIKRVSFFVNSGQLDRLYELIYDAKNHPLKMNTWGNDPSSAPNVITFFHDSRGRLIKRSFINGLAEDALLYEYNNNDHVIRAFYQLGSERAVLAHENLSFDNRRRFFGWVSELDVLYIYIRGFDPGETNVLTSRIHAASALYLYPEPHDVSNGVRYGANGMVNSVVSLTEYGGEFYSNIKYEQVSN